MFSLLEKFSPNHQRQLGKLPGTFSETNILATAPKFDSEILPGNQATVQRVLPKEEFKLRSTERIDPRVPKERLKNFEHTEANWVQSTEKDPAVLVVEGASLCTLLLLVDKNGNARAFHAPLAIQFPKGLKSAEQDLDNFFTGAEDVVSQEESLLLITGTNVIDPKDIEIQKQIVEFITNHPARKERFPNQQIETLFIRPEYSGYLKEDFDWYGFDKKQDKQRKTGNNTLPSMPAIGGILYVPRQINPKNLNSIVIVGRTNFFNEDTTKELLFP